MLYSKKSFRASTYLHCVAYSAADFIHKPATYVLLRDRENLCLSPSKASTAQEPPPKSNASPKRYALQTRRSQRPMSLRSEERRVGKEWSTRTTSIEGKQ